MSSEGRDDHDLSHPEALSAAGGRSDSDDPPNGLSSEALAHLQIQWEHFSTHVRLLKHSKIASDHDQLIDDLKRIRNTLVVLEKPALEYVIRELLLVFDNVPEPHFADDSELTELLTSADEQIAQYIQLMQEDVSVDNALVLVPLINDCRAFRDDMLLSDSLMLAAGIRLPESQSVSLVEEHWSAQRRIWVDFASSRSETLSGHLLEWRQNDNTTVVASLVRALNQFAVLTAQHMHLKTLTPLFQSASVVVRATHLQQLDDGPALRSLFRQLERNVHRCALVAAPEDLLPGDLLRNFLYYVAQTTSESSTDIELLRRFRLDRVRQVAQATQVTGTPTIGVVYHLTNAIRCGVTQETESLRAWLDTSDDSTFERFKLIRLRVRLGQLEPILTLMGNVQSVQCLQAINTELIALSTEQLNEMCSRTTLSQSLVLLDRLLDQSARRSVLKIKSVESADICGDDVYIDMATDACLREARHDLQRCADSLLPMVQSYSIDATVGHRIMQMLNRADSALQVLPLPEVSPLFRSLISLLEKLFLHLSLPSEEKSQSLLNESASSDVTPIHDMLCSLLASLDSYLGCVLHPQPAASQFLTDAEEILERIRPVIETLSSVKRVSAVEGGVYSEHSEPLLGELSVSDIGSLTLNVDDDLLDTEVEEDHTLFNSTLQLVSEHECLSHLESLDESVRRALKPSADSETHLPNEQMLRALHTLTESAQSINATGILAISQPLQRASLALYREGRHFNAEQTRMIGDLVLAVRARLHALSDGTEIEESVFETEKKLGAFLSQAVSNMRQPLPSVLSESALTISSQVSSLNDVFANEATVILDQLRELILRSPFDETSATSALGLLHTLKGSAQVAGKKGISDCAHALESEVRSLGTVGEQLIAFKTGYSSLRGYQLQNMARQASEDSPAVSSSPQNSRAINDDHTDGTEVNPHKLLELAADLTFNQARVTDELERLTAVCNDIQHSTMRWRELRRNGDLPDSPAFREMIADMEASRTDMLTVLKQAQRQNLQSSTLSASVHRELVRSQLTRLDQMRDRLTQTIDEVASHCGVSARLQMSGGELMLDKRIYQQLIAPLEHLARNAVVHGIESAEQRELSGKHDVGVISIEAKMDGTQLVLRFSDDGRGVSPIVEETLSSKIAYSGAPAQSEIQTLLFSTGFSSVEKPDVFAGHGLGLSAVKSMVEKMSGQVQLDSTGSEGFSITLLIPQQLVVNQVILVQSDERLYGIPIAHTRSVQMNEGNTVADSDESGSSTPAVPLHALLGKRTSNDVKTSPLVKPSLWVHVSGRSLSIEVDKVIGYRELLVQNLGPQLESLQRYSAGSVLSSGQQVLVVDLAALPDSSVAGQRISPQADCEDFRPAALVVDDSPTTRKAAQSILQNRGIDVSTCNDGLEALDLLSKRLPQIMVIDLEMPRMDGFSLVRQIKARYGEARPPFIMASSRDDKSNRELALSLGAAMFLAKPYTEERLLDAVEAAGLRLPDLTIA